MKINVNKYFDITNPDDFWKDNSQLQYLKPYSKLYKNDKSRGKNVSSKVMWYIVFMLHPDKEINIFANVDYTRRDNDLKESLLNKINLEKISYFEECYDSFEDDCLIYEEKRLGQLIKVLDKQVLKLMEEDITYDTSGIEIVEGVEKWVTRKGNSKAVTDLLTKLPTLIDNIVKATNKLKNVRLKGVAFANEILSPAEEDENYFDE